MNRIETVPSGAYYVTRKTDISAQAFLGSCVGLIIFDPQNEVGGLYHILLPEPSSLSTDENPEKYATHGLPLFFAELERVGAEYPYMQAIVAGGALMGDVSNIDLELDIGGRTADIVLQFLEERNINIVKIETGGYFGYKMTADFWQFDYDIELIGSNIFSRRKPQLMEDLENIDSIITRIKPIPQIALKVIRMIHGSDVSMATIGKEIRQDQVLTARLIQLSNSAFIAPRHRIDTVDEAVVVLGERRVLLLTLGIFTEVYYKEADNGYSLCKGGLFQHALGVAKAAEEIARVTRIIEPELGYTAGLLHDIGKIVLDQWVDSFYPMFYRNLYNDENLTLIEVERKLFNIDHTMAGAKLAELWELPETLSFVIQQHHSREQFNVYPELMHVINFANLLISYFKTGLILNKFERHNLEASVQYLKLDREQIIQILERIPFNRLQSFSEEEKEMANA